MSMTRRKTVAESRQTIDDLKTLLYGVYDGDWERIRRDARKCALFMTEENKMEIDAMEVMKACVPMLLQEVKIQPSLKHFVDALFKE